jgi:hypothetical protein
MGLKPSSGRRNPGFEGARQRCAGRGSANGRQIDRVALPPAGRVSHGRRCPGAVSSCGMPCDLLRFYGDVVSELPATQEDEGFLFAREVLAVPPRVMTTDRVWSPDMAPPGRVVVTNSGPGRVVMAVLVVGGVSSRMLAPPRL